MAARLAIRLGAAHFPEDRRVTCFPRGRGKLLGEDDGPANVEPGFHSHIVSPTYRLPHADMLRALFAADRHPSRKAQAVKLRSASRRRGNDHLGWQASGNLSVSGLGGGGTKGCTWARLALKVPHKSLLKR
jgi:hypothetical protein